MAWRARCGRRSAATAARGFCALLAACVGLLALAAAAGAQPRGSFAGIPVVVGTSADYAPWSFAAAEGEPVQGFEIALVAAWARDRERPLAWVRFRWPKLLADLEAKRFDFAASGITVRTERSAAARFTVPTAESAAWVLARTPERWSGPGSLNRHVIRIAVNAGGHLERVAAATFPRATRIAIPDNQAVLQALIDETVHAVVTDSYEAPHWEAKVEVPLLRLGPFSQDRKAWLVRSDHAELADDLDAWLLAKEADGTLARLRKEWLGEAAANTADPLGALLAAVDERLTLMPVVGKVKRESGVALEVPEREQVVLDRAVADLAAAALRADREPPPEESLRALFRAQMEAAKRVQWAAVKDPDYEPEPPLPDLDSALRPALLRIGARIANLVLALPANLDPGETRAAAKLALRVRYLDESHRDAIADAIAACSVRGDAPTSAETTSE